jgi:LDH2 family malate/lactate/ureidoglycolate dehydrogenase
MKERKFSATQLQNFCESIFKTIGCSDLEAQKAATVLVSADLRGIDSHGVARLTGYVKQWEMQKLNTKPNIQIVHETPSTATVDGDSGLGLIVAQEAMNIAIQKATQVGSGWVAVRNSGHFGIAGYHAMMALPYDMIGICLTHSTSLSTPTYSLEKLLGTNPIAVAIPADKEPAFVADLATTTVAYGKLQILQRKGLEAPLGWAQDEEGQPTTNPHAPKEGGALTPLGSDDLHSSYKGYCLGATVDILSGVLSGANFGPWVPPFATAGSTSERQPPVGLGTGHFFGAMRIDGFRPAAEFKKDMDLWIQTFRNAKAIPGKRVLIPGEPETMAEKDRLQNGIPLIGKVQEELHALALGLEIESIFGE